MFPTKKSENRPNPMRQFANQIDSLFTTQLSHIGSMRIDMQEEDDEYLIHADVPGYEKEEISVELDATRQILTITAEAESYSGEDQTEENEDEGVTMICNERQHTHEKRSITLPHPVQDTETIDASYSNGVLSITLPKENFTGSGERIQIN